MKPVPLHEKHQHRRYWMTCDDFEHLRDRAGDRCEICQRPGDTTSHGMLYIDHDIWRGVWAVRGLLCGRCNTLLEDGRHATEAAMLAYLERPWVDERHGSTIKEPPEPPVGALARVPGRRGWFRVDTLWHGTGNYKGINTTTWPDLTWKYPPHLLRITEPFDEGIIDDAGKDAA